VDVSIVGAEISRVIFTSSWFRSRLADQIVPARRIQNAVDQLLESVQVRVRLDPAFNVDLRPSKPLATLAQQDPLGFVNRVVFPPLVKGWSVSNQAHFSRCSCEHTIVLRPFTLMISQLISRDHPRLK
jgi:hypothetical protein